MSKPLFDKTVDGFINYMEERESIRDKKRQNKPRPYTDDLIMQRYKFCNNDREDDKGTVELMDKIRPFGLDQQLFYIFLYRGDASRYGIIQNITDDFVEDVRLMLNDKFSTFGNSAYTPVYGQANVKRVKGDGTSFNRHMFFKRTQDVIKDFKPIFLKYNSVTMIDCANDLQTLYKKHINIALKFAPTEISKDLSILYPERIDPKSMCKLGPGAEGGLSIIKDLTGVGRRAKVRYEDMIKQLNKKTGRTFNVLEHALCEFNSYHERWDYYLKHDGQFDKNNRFIDYSK